MDFTQSKYSHFNSNYLVKVLFSLDIAVSVLCLKDWKNPSINIKILLQFLIRHKFYFLLPSDYLDGSSGSLFVFWEGGLCKIEKKRSLVHKRMSPGWMSRFSMQLCHNAIRGLFFDIIFCNFQLEMIVFTTRKTRFQINSTTISVDLISSEPGRFYQTVQYHFKRPLKNKILIAHV